MNKAALLSLSALVAIACAAPTTPGPEDTGDGDGDNGGDGDTPSTGGTVAGTGGTIVAGTGGTVVGSTGGTTAGTGGVVLNTGGTVSGTGGTVVGGTGGSTPIGANCSATAWTANNGYADNGTMCGFAWTTGWDGATVTPPCGTAGPCFETAGTELCLDATIPASADPMYPGAMIGWNVGQAVDSATPGNWTATGTGLTANFTATGATGQARVVIQSGATDYCANVVSGMTVPWSGFTVGCWEAGGAAFSAGMPVKAVAVQINSTDAAQTVNLCLTSITNN